MNKALIAVLSTVVLSAAGIGLVLPIIPQLLREVGHMDDLGWRFGAFNALYALMQFVFSPLLGSLSDKFGRRPVLLASLAGSCIDYIFMALAPGLWLLFIGRAIAGLTGANMAVASAYIADVTPEEERAARYGLMNACFGIGFIIGPIIGGVLGDSWVRAPFLAAAALTGLNFAVAWFAVTETRHVETKKIETLNPLEPLRWAFRFPQLVGLLVVFVAVALVGEVGGTIWVLFGQDRFAWDGMTIGISLAGFGIFHALAQIFVAGPVSKKWGQDGALVIGLTVDTIAFLAIASVTTGWVAFLLLPLFCIGGIGQPALQAILANSVTADRQGQLQGVLASLTGLATVIGPLTYSTIYFAWRAESTSVVWLIGAGLNLLCLAILAWHFRTHHDAVPVA